MAATNYPDITDPNVNWPANGRYASAPLYELAEGESALLFKSYASKAALHEGGVY